MCVCVCACVYVQVCAFGVCRCVRMCVCELLSLFYLSLFHSLSLTHTSRRDLLLASTAADFYSVTSKLSDQLRKAHIISSAEFMQVRLPLTHTLSLSLSLSRLNHSHSLSLKTQPLTHSLSLCLVFATLTNAIMLVWCLSLCTHLANWRLFIVLV